MPAKIADLFPALVECFTIILLGYISGRANIVTPKQATGLGKFVSHFALPALLFKNMVELDFSTVNWSFMVAVLIGKATVFAIVLVLSIVLLRRKRLARGSLYSIFATQSNDFALGYPLISALYGNSHPEFIQYIYLLAPISLLILNPIGFVILEIDKNHKAENPEYMMLRESTLENEKVYRGDKIEVIETDDTEASVDDSPDVDKFTWRSCLAVMKGVLLNPLVFMVFIGLAGHFIFHGKLPSVIGNTLATLGNAFAGSALFFLGLTMVGKISSQKGMDLLIPGLLIIAKVLVLPVVIRQFCVLLSSVIPVHYPSQFQANATNVSDYSKSLSDYGYLYGTFPSAPTVVIYAARYNLEADRLAAGMVLCTSLSAPIMYISAWTLSMGRMSYGYFHEQVASVGKDTSIVTLLCSVWCIIVFLVAGKFKRVPHAVTFAYMFSLVISSLGTILWDGFAGLASNSEKLFLFGMMYFGVKLARLYVASMSIILVAVLWKGQRAAWSHSFACVVLPVVGALVCTVSLMATTTMQDITEDGVFVYGIQQDIVSLVVLLFCFGVTCVCLIIVGKIHDNYPDRTLSSSSSLLSRSVSPDHSSEEDMAPFGTTGEKIACCVRKRCVVADIQRGRHIVLLILLMISIFLGICLICWRLFNSRDVEIYFELAFLDSVFNFGQGVFIFILFGLDNDLIIDPIIRLYRKLRYGSPSISLPDLSSMDQAVLLQCLQFIRHHLSDCKLDIVSTRTIGLVSYEDVFTGADFCDWVIDRGLVNDRAEAGIYGQNLLSGRVMHHITHRHYFYDRNYLYRFEEPKPCLKVTKNTVRLDSSDHDDSEGTSQGRSTRSNTVNIAVSPLKRPYFGYSFEAYLSDTEIPASLRKNRMRRYASPEAGLHANLEKERPNEFKYSANALKKVFPKGKTYAEFSDSSMD